MIRAFILLMLISGTLSSEAQQVELVDFRHTQCDKPVSEHRIRVRVISKQIESDTFKVSIGFAASCCMEFNGVGEMAKDTLYLTLQRKTDDFCFCTCCYQADFKLTGVRNVDVPIKFHDKVIEYSTEKYETFPPSYQIVKNDTINYTDKYGLKQGKWWKDEKSYRVYTDNRLSGWGEILSNHDINEYNVRTKTFTLTNKEGKILKTYRENN